MDPLTLEQQANLDLLLDYKEAKQRLFEATRAWNEAREAFCRAICVWDEMDDKALPDGRGHFWIVSACGPSDVTFRHTSEMAHD